MKNKIILMLILTLVFMFSGVTSAAESPEMVLVEAGTTSEDNGSITVENNFYIGKYSVTQAEFKRVMGFNPSSFTVQEHPHLSGNSDYRPVEAVTWYDAVMFCNMLSEAEGLEKYYNISDIEYHTSGNTNNIRSATVTENEGANGYRLPTENEHVYAARGGRKGIATVYPGSDNVEEVAWYQDNSQAANSELAEGIGTMPVGEKTANELGLYDMSGNVYDWTSTDFRGHSFRRRGGSWYNSHSNCRVGFSNHVNPSYRYSPNYRAGDVGFRLARNTD